MLRLFETRLEVGVTEIKTVDTSELLTVPVWRRSPASAMRQRERASKGIDNMCVRYRNLKKGTKGLPEVNLIDAVPKDSASKF